ncbi:MAG: DUF3868 domain-containing protein [Dysgonomonas sp.]|nr:DUF3868 domain-containing protein [Dysgonomonas sp.]
MKKKTLLLVLMMYISCGVINSQEIYKGQIYVTSKQFYNQDDKLYIKLKMNISTLVLPSEYYVTLTPVVKYMGQSQALPDILVNGSKKHKEYLRQEALAKSTDNAPGMVVESSKDTPATFFYETSIPYTPQMKEATLFIRTRDCGCNGEQVQEFEDLVVSGVNIVNPANIRVDNSVLNMVDFLGSSQTSEGDYTKGGIIPLSKGLSNKEQEYEIYYRLRDVIHQIEQQQNTTILDIELIGYTAPIGNVKKSEKNGIERALSLQNYLRSLRMDAKAPLNVSWVAEDWSTITTLIKESDIVFKDAILDIINNVSVQKGREEELIKLANGVAYKQLKDRIFPQVRRLEYNIHYRRKAWNPDENTSLLQFRPDGLTLNEFFQMAQNYTKGSDEFNDIYDLAARLYPESPEANINAAAVALTQNNTAKARSYMEKFMTYPPAFNNIGVLLYMEGNTDKAEVYLQLAKDAGSTQAAQTLEYIKTKRSFK